MVKLGANEPCHCGSGEKYKKCCRDQDDRRNRRWTPSPSEQASIAQFAQKMQEEVEKAKYEAPRYHEFELGGQKFRAVGRGIYPEQSAGQLSATVIEHFKSQILGQKWLEEEGRKPADEQHFLMRWLTSWDELRRQAQAQDQSAAVTYVPLPGEVQELLAVADDACRILQVQKRFPDKLRRRLLNWREFQGARYEVAVAGIFIRSNFDIEWINDKTGPANKAGKRCEFNAVHRATCEVVAVEAKSRRRSGTLHEPGEMPDLSSLQADVSDLYKKAAEKKPDDRPFAIFIDVNLPLQPENQGLDKTWVPEVRAILEQFAKNNPSDPVPFSFFFATNFAWHYRGREVARAPENMFLYVPEGQTRFPVAWPTFDAVGRAVKDYGKLQSGYLRTDSNRPLPVPESAHHVTVDLTVMTQSRSRAMSGSGRTIGQGYWPSRDAPHLEAHAVKIPVLEGTSVKQVTGVWYELTDGIEAMDGFERFDVSPRTDEHKNTHFNLLASSRRGTDTEVSVRVHVLYEGD